MKTTRQIFVVNGKDEIVRTILKQVGGFKAITVVDGNATNEDIIEIFKHNKSIVCRGTTSNNIIFQLTPIFITGIDGTNTTSSFGNTVNIRNNIVLQFMEIAEKYNVDIGDHKSNTTEKEGSLKEDCLFCKLLAGKPIHKQEPLYETENFLVIPGSGAFVDGYLMILPKKHVMSCAELSYEIRLEMYNVLQDIKLILRSIYQKDILIWENGSGTCGHGKSKNSIVHAHIHACPCLLDILQTTKMSGINLKEIDVDSLPDYSKNSYLFVINYDNKWYICSDTKLYIPRQYVRQLIALEQNINTDLWDWRRYPFWTNVEKTGNVFLDYIRTNYDYLPSRIQNATRKFI